MEENLQELLDKIYEFEGLIILSLQREDRKKDLLSLITRKGSEISVLTNNLKRFIPSEEENLFLAFEEKDNSDKKDNIVNDEDFRLEYQIDDDELENRIVIDKALTPIVEQKDSLVQKDGFQSRGKLVFSINNKFRFKKELFNDSDLEFNNTLALVASMESYEEAEDYFISEKDWNLSNPNVSSFLEILKHYFG